MKVIARPRQAGKTTGIIIAAAEAGAYIVCPTMVDVERIWHQAKELGVRIKFPVTWSEFIHGRYCGRGIDGFMIDDLDRCLQSMTPVPLLAVSLSTRTRKEPNTK